MIELFNSHYMDIVPLIVAASIVYGATRDERPIPILHHIFRSAVWMTTFLGGIMIVFLLIGWLLR